VADLRAGHTLRRYEVRLVAHHCHGIGSRAARRNLVQRRLEEVAPPRLPARSGLGRAVAGAKRSRKPRRDPPAYSRFMAASPFWRGSADADLGRSDEELPTWIPAVWDIITADQELAAAASFWHQGLLATARHPSLALVAYIASIEQTARWLESGGHLAKSKGARQRVDAAIALVASDGERMVLSPVYRIRSGTAHGAALHSTETVLGAYFSLNYMPGDPAAGSRPTLEPDLPDPLQVFTRQLHTAKTVAQRLIFVAFNSKLQEAVS